MIPTNDANRVERGNSSVRMAHVVLSLNMGGLERVLIRLLAATDRRQFLPVVFALDEPGSLAVELSRLRVPLHVIPRAQRGVDLSLPARLAAHFHRDDVQLIHTHNSGPHFYASLAARVMGLRWGTRPPVIHTKHGRDEPHLFRTVLLNRISSALCDHIVAVSGDAADVAVNIEHADARKVRTILNGVDTQEFHPAIEQRTHRTTLGIPLEGIHVVCVARLAKVKDHLTLLEAVLSSARQ